MLGLLVVNSGILYLVGDRILVRPPIPKAGTKVKGVIDSSSVKAGRGCMTISPAISPETEPRWSWGVEKE